MALRLGTVGPPAGSPHAPVARCCGGSRRRAGGGGCGWSHGLPAGPELRVAAVAARGGHGVGKGPSRATVRVMAPGRVLSLESNHSPPPPPACRCCCSSCAASALLLHLQKLLLACQHHARRGQGPLHRCMPAAGRWTRRQRLEREGPGGGGGCCASPAARGSSSSPRQSRAGVAPRGGGCATQQR